MDFNLKGQQHKKEDPTIQKELSEKLFSAEKNVAIIRLFVIILNIFVYTFFLKHELILDWLGESVIIVATLYSAFVLLFRPYKKYHLFHASYFTTGTDALLITLWIVATGGHESPFYVLWYVSILSVAMRYSMKVTLVTASIYSVLYFTLFWADINFVNLGTHIADILIRIGNLFFIAVTAGLMANEIMDQIQGKIFIKKSREEIRKREQQIKEAHDKLEERVKERTEELNESNTRLTKINEDLDHFVYSASHDLKSPILNIEGLINILYQEHKTKSAYEKHIKEKLEISLEKIKKRIDSLAEVAKAQKEIYDDVEVIRFEEILRDLISENEEIIKKENAQLEYNFNSASTITCSRTCIKSIMYNFLTNSIKYRAKNRAPVISFRTEKDKDYISLFVKDNGLGIDLKRNKEKLFTIFKRFHDHVEGAGIGLYTVKKMVEKQNGDIDVESQPGVGTTFKVRFKVCEEVI